MRLRISIDRSLKVRSSRLGSGSDIRRLEVDRLTPGVVAPEAPGAEVVAFADRRAQALEPALTRRADRAQTAAGLLVPEVMKLFAVAVAEKRRQRIRFVHAVDGDQMVARRDQVVVGDVDFVEQGRQASVGAGFRQ